MLLNEKKNHYLRTGLILTGLMTALALVGCVWTPYSPTAMSGSEKFLAPCLRHLFGTDNFGRDIFSRVLAGAGTTFFISAATVCIGAAAGTLVGAFTGYFGGWLDEALMRVNDAVTAFPSILLALVFRAAGVCLCMAGTALNRKERLFCVIAYLPKATVQAAIGSVPLAMGLPCGQIVLSVAVLAILITAPLGAIGMDATYQKLLEKQL